MSRQVTETPDSDSDSSSFCSSDQFDETPRLFCIDDESQNGDIDDTPGQLRVPRLQLNDVDDQELILRRLFQDTPRGLDDLVAKHLEHQVATAVVVLGAGTPTLCTQLLARAEQARHWLLSFPTVADAVEKVTDAAEQRAPRVATDVTKVVSKWFLGELHASQVAVKAFSRPEVFLLEAPASDCPATPHDALDCLMIAVQRGRPSVEVRTLARLEHARRKVLHAWNLAEQVGRDVFASKVACNLAQKMRRCAAIADVYEQENPRVLEPER
jgi:hypothetical protein